MKLLLSILLLATAVAAQGRAQVPWGISADSLSDQTTVSLLTMLPGKEVYSLFGHSSIRIHDPASGLDWTYNYGTFDFQQSFFVLRFLRGTLDYILDSAPFENELERYRQLERPIIEQRLNLPPETTRELFRFLEWNAQPENRAYRYDFFYDNCSTRILDAFDRSLTITGSSPIVLSEESSDETFRQFLQPYIENRPWLQTGINVGLGLPADKHPTPRQRTFLPIELMNEMDRARINGRPLVATRDTLFWIPGYGNASKPIPWPLLLTSVLLAVALGLTFRQWRIPPSQLARGFDALLFSLTGFCGLILLLLWVASDHDAPNWNLNLLWAWPTHLVAAWPLRKASPPLRGWRRYLLATAIITGLLALAWPWLPQPLSLAAWPLAATLAIRGFTRGFLKAEDPNSNP